MKSFYAERGISLRRGKQSRESMHRRILGLEYGDKREGDHRNHVTLDNRRANIRIVTRAENAHNNRGRGFYWNKRERKYMAYLRVDGVDKYLGYYDNPKDARSAYLAAKKIHHPSAPVPEEL